MTAIQAIAAPMNNFAESSDKANQDRGFNFLSAGFFLTGWHVTLPVYGAVCASLFHEKVKLQAKKQELQGKIDIAEKAIEPFLLNLEQAQKIIDDLDGDFLIPLALDSQQSQKKFGDVAVALNLRCQYEMRQRKLDEVNKRLNYFQEQRPLYNQAIEELRVLEESLESFENSLKKTTKELNFTALASECLASDVFYYFLKTINPNSAKVLVKMDSLGGVLTTACKTLFAKDIETLSKSPFWIDRHVITRASIVSDLIYTLVARILDYAIGLIVALGAVLCLGKSSTLNNLAYHQLRITGAFRDIAQFFISNKSKLLCRTTGFPIWTWRARTGFFLPNVASWSGIGQ